MVMAMNIAAFNFSDYFTHLRRNLRYKPDTTIRSHKNHTIWTLTMIFGYPVFELVHWCFLGLDRIFRRKHEQVCIEKPVFIIGSFRSGSTFLQRLMGMDTQTFASGTTWEMMFAPSVLQRQAVKGLFTVDKFFGRPLKRFLSWAEGSLFHEKASHKMGLEHAEEDEAFFIHNYASSFLFFANPYLEEATKYFRFDSMVDGHTRKVDMEFYHQMIQRHMYAHPESKYYLSKSPTFSSRFLSLYRRYPDARFVYLARNPIDVIPSLMTWFTEVWSNIEKDGIRFPFKEFIFEFVYHWYVDALEMLKQIPEEQVKIVTYDDLVSDPYDTVCDIYRWLDIEMPVEYEQVLSLEKARAKRTWKPKQHKLEVDNIDPNQLRQRFLPVFERFGFTLEGYV